MKLTKITAGLCAGVLAFGGVAGGIPVQMLTAFAEDAAPVSGTCGENLTWTLDSAGTLTISGTGDMEDYADASPAPWKENKVHIKTVVIGDDVTSIGNSAFYGCTGLTSVTIPDSVTSIGDSTFYGCTGLTSVTIPDSVTSIKTLAFQGCAGLTEIVLPKFITSIENYTFYGCSKLNAVTIPDGVTSIGVNAFAKCYKLTEIIIPASVTDILTCVFIDCSGLEKITILNPECVIHYNEYTRMVPKATLICGYSNSTAQAYAESFGQTFEVLDEAPVSEPNPDMDGDGEITASDAQTILIAFAALLTEHEPDLTPEQLAAADVDGNGEITALDAQFTLAYFLYNTVLDTPTTWSEILHPNDE